MKRLTFPKRHIFNRHKRRHWSSPNTFEVLEGRQLLAADLSLNSISQVQLPGQDLGPAARSQLGDSESQWSRVAKLIADHTVSTIEWNGRPALVMADEWIVRRKVSPRIQAAQAVMGADQHNSFRAEIDSLSRANATASSDPQVSVWKGSATEIAELATYSDVELIEPNFLIWSTATTPNDSFFDRQWGLDNPNDTDIDAPEAWEIFTGTHDVVIASIDSGVDYRHGDLAENMWVNPLEIPGDRIDNDGNGYVDDVYGIDTANHDSDPDDDGRHFTHKPNDDGRHGTHTTGIFAAVGNNETGTAGVNWATQVMALKVLDETGFGTVADAIEAIDYMTMMKQKYGINIVASNNSWGGVGYSQMLQDSVQASNDAGIMFVAAAGNRSKNNDVLPFYPASYDLDGIIAVAASNRDGEYASFSSYGAKSVDLAAPGVGIWSTGNDQEIGWVSPKETTRLTGTSVATPFVTGVVAALMGSDPTATLAEVKTAILDSVKPLANTGEKTTVSGGLLDFDAALSALGLRVTRATPGRGDVIFDPVDEFRFTLNKAIDISSVSAEDLTVNGVPAETVRVDGTTVLLSYLQSPITDEGTQRVEIAVGAFTQANGGDVSLPYAANFQYDLLPMEVVGSSLDANSKLPLTSIEIEFNEAFDPETLDIHDLQLSQGTVAAAVAVDANTASFIIDGVTLESELTVTLSPAGLTDALGSPVLPYTSMHPLDYGTVSIPAFQPIAPAGSRAYESEIVGTLDTGEDEDRFTLDLAAGQLVSIAAYESDVSAPNSLLPRVRLIGPDTSTMAEVSTTASGTQRLSAEAAANGTYTILVDSPRGATGAYSLGVVVNASYENESSTTEGSNDTIETAEVLTFHTRGDVTIGNTVAVSRGEPVVIYETDLSTDPEDGNHRWDLHAGWSWGKPRGVAGDPASGFTGDNVIGFNLRGAYSELEDAVFAQLPVLDTRGMQFVELSFERWLSIDSEDLATITVSTDRKNWTEVYSNHEFEIDPKQWVTQTIDLSGYAGQEEVRVRFNMGPTIRPWDVDSHGGWNLDDIRVTGVPDKVADVYSRPLSEGEVVSIAVAARTPDDTMAALTLRTGDGTVVAMGQPDAAGGFSINDWLVPADNSYFVEVKAFGQYAITATKDISFGHVNALQPQPQDINLTGSVLGSITPTRQITPIDSEPNDDGKLGISRADLLLAQDLTDSFTLLDDHQYRVSVTGEISAGDDQDWDFFRFTAAPGDFARIDLLGSQFGHGTLLDPYLLIFDRNGKLMTIADNGIWLDASKELFDFPYAGEYYIAADSYRDGVGTYKLQLTMDTNRNLLTRGNPTYQFAATAGDEVVLTLTTFPGTVGNVLNAAIDVLGPDGESVTSSDLAENDSHSFLATLDGDYRVVISGEDGSLGDYLLAVTGNTGSPSPFEITSTDVQDVVAFGTAPEFIEVGFSRDLLVSSLSADDLQIAGSPAASMQVIDATTARFTLPELAEGENIVSISAHAVASVRGDTLLPFTDTIVVDTAAPVVTTSMERNAVVSTEGLVIEVQFSEPMRLSPFSPKEIVLTGQFNKLSPRFFSWNETSDALTLNFGDVPDDGYELRLPDTLFADLAGNDIDGDRDGRAGDDYEIEFAADAPARWIETTRAPMGESPVRTATASGHAGPGDEGDQHLIELKANQLVAVHLEALTARDDVQATLSGPGIDIPIQIDSDEQPRIHAFRATTSGTYVLDVARVGDDSAPYAARLYFDAQLADEEAETQTLIASQGALGAARHYSVIGELDRSGSDTFELTLAPTQMISIAAQADRRGLSIEMRRGGELLAISSQTPNFNALISNFSSPKFVLWITCCGKSLVGLKIDSFGFVGSQRTLNGLRDPEQHFFETQ